jgi:hypothetical protein
MAAPYLIRSGRAAPLARFVDYVLGHEKVWIQQSISSRWNRPARWGVDRNVNIRNVALLP